MDAKERFAPALENVSRFETVWMFGPNADLLVPVPGPVRLSWWDATPAMSEFANQAIAKSVRVGPVLHNAGPDGFDPAIAKRLFKDADRALASLQNEMSVRGWRALNIDLESLPATMAPEYEAFLRKVRDRFSKADVAVSVCLHAKTDAKGTYEGARFQRWERLARLPFNFVVMGYDHAWAGSEPGPVSPMTWLEAVTTFAHKQFNRERVTIALPLFGYHWKKDAASPSGWKGAPDIAPALAAILAAAPKAAPKAEEVNWKRDDQLPLADGYLFRRGDAEAIAFDDDSSALAKISGLSRSGLQRIAFWRLGGEDGSLYRATKRDP